MLDTYEQFQRADAFEEVQWRIEKYKEYRRWYVAKKNRLIVKDSICKKCKWWKQIEKDGCVYLCEWCKWIWTIWTTDYAYQVYWANMIQITVEISEYWVEINICCQLHVIGEVNNYKERDFFFDKDQAEKYCKELNWD